jgi:hypothetical protein
MGKTERQKEDGFTELPALSIRVEEV